MAHRLHVTVEGDVQGVGFRYSTLARASSLQLAGWVRNCLDGSVEAVFEGDRDDLEAMLGWCRIGPSSASVTQVRERWEEGPAQYTGFRVRM